LPHFTNFGLGEQDRTAMDIRKISQRCRVSMRSPVDNVYGFFQTKDRTGINYVLTGRTPVKILASLTRCCLMLID
jgi:hypothetical protein